ncbi:MAG: tyrosine-type recombinase/integrase [Acidobacteriaceae bacterium]|jgi:integrase|nr:tyrosine-type recombinase/integrase [Acidobacteriaceae bacterium]
MPRPRGTGSLYQRNGSEVWWIKYHRNGKPYRESTQTTDKRRATRILALRLAEINTGTFVGPRSERITVAELAEDFLRDYRINGRKSIDDVDARWRLHIGPFFEQLRTAQVTSELVAKYVDMRQSEGAQNATINREMAALKRMFRLGMYATPPKVLHLPKFPKLMEDNVRKGFLEDAQYSKLIDANSELWFRALVEMGRTYGWRISELLGLHVGQIDLEARTIRLDPGTTKNRDGREVTMTGPVHALLSECVTGKPPEDAVFTWPDGRPVKDFRGAWANATKAAGVPGLLFHDLRRTAARNLRRAGIAEGVIMKIGGWRTRSVFERYAIVSQTDIADALKKLESS